MYDEDAIYYPGLETKSAHTGAVQDTTPEGVVTAVASVFDVADEPPELPGMTPDIVHEKAFDETLLERKGRIDHLLNHNWGIVLGKHQEIWPEKGVGLMAKSAHNMDSFWGFETFQLIKNGDMQAYSFSFLPKKNTPEQKSWERIDGVRHLHRLSLFELGPTPNGIAIHPAARVVGTKSLILPDTQWPDLLTQAENVLAGIVREGEALIARREAQGRKGLSSAALSTLEEKSASLDALVKQLQSLAAPAAGEPSSPDREVGSAKGLLARRDLARARLKQVGLNLEG